MAIKNLTPLGAIKSYDEQVALVFGTLAQMKATPAVRTTYLDPDTGVATDKNWTQGTAIAILLGNSAIFDQAFKVYAWDPDLTTAGNDTTIVQPTAITGANPGRWRSP